MNFKKVNNIAGWLVFAISYFVYLKTMEATASLWDCGEFISTSYRLGVAHSPGAPLFMMMGRIFSLFAPSQEYVALMINSMSALFSALTILFLFWTITHFAKKVITIRNNEELTLNNLIAIIGAGAVGALAYTFSDTFWFSAVEAEVYAASSVFTAFVVWAILKWEHSADEKHADRWLILIFYVMGLSVGVHLLNLLTIPALIMVYYFKRYTPTVKGGITAFLIGCLILAFIQFGVIQYLPIIASKFEIFFVNSLGTGFHYGTVFFLLIVAVVLALLIVWAKKKQNYFLHLATLCVTFIIIGYSSYVTVIIRSNADVPIDMSNPENIVSLIPYLQRDQYGSQPLITGQDYNSRIVEVKNERKLYAPVQKDGKDHYQFIDHKVSYKFDKTRVFPRLWSFSDPRHTQFYQMFLGLGEMDEPSSLDNQKFFWGYQVNWMWWRYFMWNYAGRQNDMQGQGEAKHGNWISGIKPIDQFFGRGDIDLLPDQYKNNGARNQYYFLPLILGILGLVYQWKRDKNDAIVIGLLYFFTGMATVMYLNNTPLQPRERDYAFAGATYAFAIWIGLGVLMVHNFIRKKIKGSTAGILASIICLIAVPVLMASEGWDDHDRSEKTIARDHAYNMLNSCDSNAILITFGDNDTYPLWYLQEVEGFRTDVRIVNYNLLGTDWQNIQMTYKINDADAIPVIWEPEQFIDGNMNYIQYSQNPRLDEHAYYDLEEVIKFFSSGENQLTTRAGERVNYLPTKRFSLKVDKEAVLANGMVNTEHADLIPERIEWEFDKNNATRADMSFLNILAGQAKTGWTRPIYMASGSPKIGLENYFQKVGVVEKFVPMQPQQSQTGYMVQFDLDKNMELLMDTYTFGKANTDRVYYDEKNRLVFLSYRQAAAELATELAVQGRSEDAIKVLDDFLDKVSENSLSYEPLLYDRGMSQVLQAYFIAGATEQIKKYGDKMASDISKEINYYNSLPSNIQAGTNEMIAQMNLSELNRMVQLAKQYNQQEIAQEWETIFQSIIPSSMMR